MEPSIPATRPPDVTLRAVAAHAGVSKSVVSRVLQGSPHVSAARRKSVEDAIRDLGYRPNGMARNLSRRRTGTVGVLVNDLRQPWFVDFLEGLNGALHERDLHAFVGDGRLDAAADDRLVRAFMDMRVDGLVLAGSMPLSPAITEAAARLPSVIAGSRDFVLDGVDVVVQNDELGTNEALEHLHSLGHRRIHHVTGESGGVFEVRRDAYVRWMSERGLSAVARVLTCDLTDDGGYAAAKSLLDVSAGDRPTAIFFANDFAGAGAVAAARELGLSVPGDVSLVGFDNSWLARMRNIGLTSVDVHGAEVGARAAQVLTDRMSDPSLDGRQFLVRPHLAVRGSSGKASP